MKVATFNVLADSYIGNSDLAHVDPALLEPEARIGAILQLIDSLEADVIALQEAELPLVEAIDRGKWRLFWAPKSQGKPDGCVMLVKNGLSIYGYESRAYSDRSGRVAQTITVNDILFANTHISWSSETDPDKHPGVQQIKELLGWLGTRSAAILADCNDHPGGPVRNQLKQSGFVDIGGDTPSAYIKGVPVAIDIVAVRGMSAKMVPTKYDPVTIPSQLCPSDHIPLVAEVELSRSW